MSRKPANNETNKPTHELVLKVELPNGEMTLGRIGLFTENNDLHLQVSEMSAERLEILLSKLSASVVEYCEDKGTRKVNLGF